MAKQIGVVIDPLELDEAWLRRIQDGGIQILGLHPHPKESTPEQIATWRRDERNIRLLERLSKAGVAIEWEVHALSWLLPRAYFAENPEWFRMNEGGQRTADHNLCCPKCRGLSAADQALTVYNAILQGLRRVDPLAKQCYLAYHDANAVPASVRPDDGIYLEYAPFCRDHRKPLADPDSSRNAAEIRNLPALVEYFGTQDAQALDYWLDNSLFSGWTKPPKEFHLEQDVLRQDAQYYHQLGFSRITTFACFLGKEYTDLYPEPEGTVRYGRILSE